MLQGTWDRASAHVSQMDARIAAIKWIMSRYSGSEDLRKKASELLFGLIPLDKDWTFSTCGKGVCYPLIARLMSLQSSEGSPSGYQWFSGKNLAVLSFNHVIVACDESESLEWKAIASWWSWRDD